MKNLFFLILAFSLILSAQNGEKHAFTVGEKLFFDVKYGFIKAAESVMQIEKFDTINGVEVFHSKFNVDTTPTFSLFYKVKDRYETYFDTKKYYSLKFKQNLREGKYKRDFYASFDYTKKIAETSLGTFPITDYVSDVISAFYYTRTIDYKNMKVGQKIYLSNFYRDRNYPLDVKYLGRQKIKVSAGEFNCILIEPFMKEGALFKSEGRVLIYLSDDDLKIPIMISTKVLIGSIDAELRDYKGLAGNLTSKVK